jgi:hypothetical protein
MHCCIQLIWLKYQECVTLDELAYSIIQLKPSSYGMSVV